MKPNRRPALQLVPPDAPVLEGRPIPPRAALYELYADFVWDLLVVERLPESARADVSHEVFKAALVGFHKLKPNATDADCRRWLTAISHNQVCKWFRANKKERERTVPLTPAIENASGWIGQARESQRLAKHFICELAHDGLAQLPPLEREALEALLDGKTVRQYAEEVDIGLPAAQSRVHRGRLGLKAAVEEQWNCTVGARKPKVSAAPAANDNDNDPKDGES